jgi:uncharacterized protein YbaR (Trm112 family)
MNPLHCDLDNEQTALCAAIDALHVQWGSHQMVYAVSDLYDATTRAESVLSTLEPQLENSELPTQLKTRGLRTLVLCAYEELQRAERFALERIGRKIAQEKSSPAPIDTIFPKGAILSCPDCGEGLYKVAAQATTEDLVCDEGTLLIPLNQAVPPRAVWTSLACPLCGGRLLRDGKIHTFQSGWI